MAMGKDKSSGEVKRKADQAIDYKLPNLAEVLLLTGGTGSVKGVLVGGKAHDEGVLWDASQSVLATVDRAIAAQINGHLLFPTLANANSWHKTTLVDKHYKLLLECALAHHQSAEFNEETSSEDKESLSNNDRLKQSSASDVADDARLALLSTAASSEIVAGNPAIKAAEEVRAETVRLLGGAGILGRPILTDEHVVEAVAAGFPADVLNSLRESGLPPAALERVVAPKRTLMRRKASKQRLTSAESDSAWRLANTLALASRVLNGRKSAVAWLSRPKELLQARTALDLLETSVGTAYINQLLRQLDWGDVA